MGRKRSSAALRIACLGFGEPLVPLGPDGEVHHHDPVLLHDTDQQDDADEGDQAEVVAERTSGSASAPTPAEGRVDRIVRGWMKLS